MAEPEVCSGQSGMSCSGSGLQRPPGCSGDGLSQQETGAGAPPSLIPRPGKHGAAGRAQCGPTAAAPQTQQHLLVLPCAAHSSIAQSAAWLRALHIGPAPTAQPGLAATPCTSGQPSRGAGRAPGPPWAPSSARSRGWLRRRRPTVRLQAGRAAAGPALLSTVPAAPQAAARKHAPPRPSLCCRREEAGRLAEPLVRQRQRGGVLR